MKVAEFKAVYAKTDTFAISPTPVHLEVPWQHLPSKPKYGKPSCPLGLIRARVIQTGVDWTSMETFGCTPGASRHMVTHKNGIGVEFAAPGQDSDFSFDYKAAEGDRHVELVMDPKDPGLVKSVRMIVSAKALVMPWSDYQPVQARRRKKQRDGERRSKRITAAMNVVGATAGQWGEYRKKGSEESTFDARRATVAMPMLLAEQLGAVIALLDAEPMDDPKVALELQRWRKDAEQFEEHVRAKARAE